MKVDKIVVGPLQENTYIITKDKKALIIDPGDEIDKIKPFLKGKELIKILITHYHFDHIGALKYFDEKLILKNLEAKQYQIGPFKFEIIFTKGHTNDSVTYYFKDDQIMFTGDFLFKETIGRTDLPTGSNEEMNKSLEKIKKYPDNIKIYPGHGEETTLKNEKQFNFFLKK